MIERNPYVDRLDATGRHELPDNEFGLPSRREYPMPDAAHVRAAEAYFRFCPDINKAELARNILTKAREFGIDVTSQAILEWARVRN